MYIKQVGNIFNNFHNKRSSKQRTNSPLIFKPVPSVSNMKYLYMYD